MELFTLLGKITIDAANSDGIIDNIGNKIQGLGGRVQASGETMSKWGSGLTKTVSVAGTALGIAAVKSAMTYEDAMAKINTIANLTADNAEISYGEMEAAIMDLSNQTGISAAVIAEDVYNAISAGQSTADAVNFVTNSTKLAKAGFAETGQSLDILTTIMNAYEIEASEVTRVSDILIQTQNLGKTTVGDLSTTMGRVIPTAKSYNVSLEQVASGYTIMTAKGIATAESTTYMNSMFNELGKSGTKVSDVLKEKTGKSFTELMAEGYTLGDCLGIVSNAADEQNLSFMDMWGSAEAAKAGVTLLGDGASVFNSRLQEMQASTGSTNMAFEKLDTTSLQLTKAINQAKNILTDLGGTIIQMLLPYLEKGAAGIQKFADWFNSLDEGTKKLIITIGGFAIAAGPVLSVVGKVTTGIGGIIKIGGSLIGGIGKVGTAASGIISIGGSVASGIGGLVAKIGGVLLPAIASVGAPVMAVVGVLGVLVGAGVAVYKNWDSIKAFGSKCWEGIKGFVSNTCEDIKNRWELTKEAASNIWNKISTSVSDAASKMKDSVVNHIQEQSRKAQESWEKLKTVAGTVWTNITTNISETVSKMKDTVVNHIQEQSRKAQESWENFKNFAGNVWTGIKDKVSSVAGDMKETVVNHIKEQSEKATENWNSFKDKTSEVWGNIKDKVSSTAGEMKEQVSNKFSELKEAAAGKWDELKEKTSSTWENVKSTVSDAAENAKNGATNAFQNMVSGVSGAMGNLFSAVQNGFGNAVGFIKNLAGNAWTWGADMISGFVNGIKSMIGKVTDAVSSVASTITSWLHFSVPDVGPLTEYESWMPDFMTGLATGIEKNKWRVTDEVADLARAMVLPDMQYSARVTPYTYAAQNNSTAYTNTGNSGNDILIAFLEEFLDKLIAALNKTKVVMSTGETVGALAMPLSDELGKLAEWRRRGI